MALAEASAEAVRPKITEASAEASVSVVHYWKLTKNKSKGLETQCGIYENSLSSIFGKHFVKIAVLLNE